MAETTTLPLPGLKRVWRIKITDSIEAPTVQINLMTRASSSEEAAQKGMKLKKAKKFNEQYPEAQVIETIYVGILETE